MTMIQELLWFGLAQMLNIPNQNSFIHNIHRVEDDATQFKCYQPVGITTVVCIIRRERCDECTKYSVLSRADRN